MERSAGAASDATSPPTAASGPDQANPSAQDGSDEVRQINAPGPDPSKRAAASNALAAQSAPRPARLRLGATTVNGHLRPERIQTIVHHHYGDLRRCYMTKLEANPQLAGRVSLRFVIHADGVVSNVTDPYSELADPDVVACFKKVFSEMCFPRPEGGIVTVVYPIMVSPGDAP